MRILVLLVWAWSVRAQGAYDLVIGGGRVVDGTGNPWFYGRRGDARRPDRADRAGGDAARRGGEAAIDARGLVVAPGFIDIQGASREPLLAGDGRVISHVGQGITTEIMGEGGRPRPRTRRRSASMQSLGARARSPRFDGPHGFDAWLRAMEEHGASLNFGSFVGAATVRQYVKGMAQGEATPAELEQMQTLVRNAMMDGAFGVASA